MTQISIFSADGSFKAVVAETRNGARVVIWQNLKGWRRMSHAEYNLPYHAVRDIAYSAVYGLTSFPMKG